MILIGCKPPNQCLLNFENKITSALAGYVHVFKTVLDGPAAVFLFSRNIGQVTPKISYFYNTRLCL